MIEVPAITVRERTATIIALLEIRSRYPDAPDYSLQFPGLAPIFISASAARAWMADRPEGRPQ
jgi:hypothetical protein